MEIVKKHKRNFFGGSLIFLGFWLSPLSPWNDLFTNIPIAYAFGFLFSLISESLFLPMVILGYWLSNIAGFILMHYGYVVTQEGSYSFKEKWKNYVLWTTLYTIIAAMLVWFEILPSAQDIVKFFSK